MLGRVTSSTLCLVTMQRHCPLGGHQTQGAAHE